MVAGLPDPGWWIAILADGPWREGRRLSRAAEGWEEGKRI
jgi:hypothetical protein